MSSVGLKSTRETLVSMAVIAILGATLLPILSGSTTVRKDGAIELANLKQLGLAFRAYADDWDDTMPLAFGRNPDGTWRWNAYASVPADALSGSTDDQVTADRSVWANAMLPYYRDRHDLSVPGNRLLQLDGFAFNQGSKPIPVGLSMNGLLQNATFADVGAPSRVPIVWESYGDSNLYGLARSSPTLNCPPEQTAPCKYDFYNGPGGRMWWPHVPTFSQNGTQTYLMADLSVVRYPDAPGRDEKSSDYVTSHIYWQADGYAPYYLACTCSDLDHSYPCLFMLEGPGFDPAPPGANLHAALRRVRMQAMTGGER